MAGGSRHTEVKELAVIPCTSPASSKVVTTVTPVANLPMALRKSFLLTNVLPFFLSVCDYIAHVWEGQ